MASRLTVSLRSISGRASSFQVEMETSDNGGSSLFMDGIDVGSVLAFVHGGRAVRGQRRRNLGSTRFEGAGGSAPLAILGGITKVTKSAESLSELLARIEAEYREMPGLNLNVSQAQRLWGLDRRTCAAIQTTLMERRVLKRTTSGNYLRWAPG